MKRSAKLYVVLLALGICGYGFGADYSQHEDFGVKSPGDLVGFTVTPPGKVLTGRVNSAGGFVWTGGPASWSGTIPQDFAGVHNGSFSGTYQPPSGTGTGGGASREYTWEADTRAKVCDRVSGSVVAVYVLPDEGESVPTGINQGHSGNYNLSVVLCDEAPATTILITRKLFTVPNGPSITITDTVDLSSPGVTSYSESGPLVVYYSYKSGEIGEHTGTISVKWQALYPGGKTVSDDDSNIFMVYVP